MRKITEKELNESYEENRHFWILKDKIPLLKKEWERRTKHICKPCWELKYCPYGILVEQFPLLGPNRESAIEHNEFLKKQLAKGAYKGKKKKEFEQWVRDFNPEDYPIEHSKEETEKRCTVFGHLYPVFFVNEPFRNVLD